MGFRVPGQGSVPPDVVVMFGLPMLRGTLRFPLFARDFFPLAVCIIDEGFYSLELVEYERRSFLDGLEQASSLGALSIGVFRDVAQVKSRISKE